MSSNELKKCCYADKDKLLYEHGRGNMEITNLFRHI